MDIENNIYASPKSEIKKPSLEKHRRPNTSNSKMLVWIGVFLQMLLITGIVFTVIGMYSLFQEIQLTGNTDPKFMAGGISQSLVPMVIFGFLALIGFLISFITMWVTGYRTKKIFKFEIFLSILFLFYIPIGTVLGFIFIVVLIKYRKQFDPLDNN